MMPAMESPERAVSRGRVLDPVLLQGLRDLTNIGHRKGILEMLYRMRDEYPESGESLEEMIRLADTLQLQALRDLLDGESDEVR